MTEMKMLTGGGGGKSGGGGGISEDPDTLSAVTYARYIDLIGEGHIDGLVNGDRSVYLDGVALRGAEGNPSYKPFKGVFLHGDSDQDPIPGFAGASTEYSVGLVVRHDMGFVIRSVPDADADAVRFNLSLSALSKTTAEGKITKNQVEFAMHARRGSGAWEQLKSQLINDKTGSRYPLSVEASLQNLAGTGPIEIAVTRTTPDFTSSLDVGLISWDSFTVINYEKYNYPNSALFALEVDARYFSQVPTRMYHVRGLWVKVPVNYDPVTRVYTGVWDGTFKWAYTNNPAWCYFALLTNRRWGLGKRISESKAGKWEIYRIAQYCDEMVPTGITSNISDLLGSGGVGTEGSTTIGVPLRQGPAEPRFTLNCVINTFADAYKVIAQLSQVFRGMSYWQGSQVLTTQDRPASPSKIWTNANVTGGVFNRQGSSRSQRHTVVSVAWNDPAEDFRPRYEYVEDREGVLRYGTRMLDMVAFGCTSRSQARRVGLWLLYTERMETEAVTFRCSLEHAQVLPGEVGQILDYKRLGRRWGGRILSATTSAITLDAEARLPVGEYRLAVSDKVGATVVRTVSIAVKGNFTVLTPTVPFAEAPPPMATWAITSTSVDPLFVRVVGVKEISAVEREITVLKHNPSKYAAIDLGVPVSPPRYSLLERGPLKPVIGLIAVENTYREPRALSPTSTIEISWDASNVDQVRGYSLSVSTDSGGVLRVPEQQGTSYTLKGVAVGTYQVEVRVVDHLGRPGATAATTSVVVLGVDTKRPENVAGVSATDVPGGKSLTWQTPVGDPSYKETEIRLGSDWDSAQSSTPLFKGAANKFLWAWPAQGTYMLLLKHRDTAGNESVAATQLVVTVNSASLISPSNLSPALQQDVNNISVLMGADTVPGSVAAQLKGLQTSVDAQIQILTGQVGELSGTPAYSNTEAYAVDRLVAYLGALYRSKVATQGHLPTDTTYWQKVGDFDSLGEVVLSHTARLDEYQQRIEATEAGAVTVAQRTQGLESSTQPFSPDLTWDFETGLAGWQTQVGYGSLQWSGSVATATSGGNEVGGIIIINDFPVANRIAGFYSTKVRMRLKRLTGAGWEGNLYYSTVTRPGFSGVVYKHIDEPVWGADGWAVAEWDMESLTEGGNEWRNSVVTGMRITLNRGAVASSFYVDWIAIGDRRLPVSTSRISQIDQARNDGDSALAQRLTSVAAASASTGSVTPDPIFQAFQEHWEIAQGEVDLIADAVVGNSVRSKGDFSTIVRSRNKAPLDRLQTYRVSAKFSRQVGATPVLVYLIVDLYDSAGGVIAGDGSSWMYVAAAADPGSAGSSYATVFGAGQPREIPANAVAMGLKVILNYSNVAGAWAQVSNLRVESANADRIQLNLDARVQEFQQALTTQSTAQAQALQTVSARLNAGGDVAQAIGGKASNAFVAQELLAVDDEITGLKAQASMKVVATRTDGRKVYGYIGTSATAPNDNTGGQSEILLMGDRLVFVPSSDPDGPMIPLFTTGFVNGQQALIVRTAVIGDATINQLHMTEDAIADIFETGPEDVAVMGSFTAA